MDNFAQTFGDTQIQLFMVTKTGATTYEIVFGANMGYSLALADDAALLTHLNTYFADGETYITNPVTRNYLLTSVNAVYSEVLLLDVSSNFKFYSALPLYYMNLVESTPTLTSDPFEFDTYDTVNGELEFVGTLPLNGVNLSSNGVKLLTLSSLTVVVNDVLDTLHQKTQEIATPTTFEITSDLGYKFKDFTIDRWSQYVLPFQTFTAANIECYDYDIDGDDPEDGEVDDFLDGIGLRCITPPSPVQTVSEWVRVETVIDGRTVDAYVFGNIVDGLYIQHNNRNRAFMRLIFNKFRTFGEGYNLDTEDVKIPLTIYYV